MKIIKTIFFILILNSTAYSQILSQSIISKNGNVNGNATSFCSFLSGDGRFTIFESDASNLADGDTNARADLFLFDSQQQSLSLLSKNSSGSVQQGGDVLATCGADISRDGSTVVYATAGTGITGNQNSNVSRIYSFKTSDGSAELLTPGNLTEGVFFPSVSQDGTKIVFNSNDPSLVSNGLFQVFLLERPANTIRMISIDAQGNPGNGNSISAAISHDGKWAAYPSKAVNLKGADLAGAGNFFQIYLVNLESGEHKLLTAGSAGQPGNNDSLSVDLSEDGNEVVFYTNADNLISADTKSDSDILLYDNSTGKLEQVALTSEGKRIKGDHELLVNSISADGERVIFRSLLGAFDKFRIEVYVRDRKNSTTYLSSFDKQCSFGEEGGQSHSGSIAPDADKIAFAIGKNTKKSALQVINVDLDVLKSVSSAPDVLDISDTDVCKDTVTIAMTPFRQQQADQIIPAMLEAKKGVTYQVRVRSGKNIVQSLNNKKNVLTLKNLKPGNYDTSFRVKFGSGSSQSVSPFSKPAKFTIK